MIEDTDLGLKIAENKIEEFWANAKKKAEESIFNAEREIELNKCLITLAISKIEEEKLKLSSKDEKFK